jgi:predicted nucleic acid-binding protein
LRLFLDTSALVKTYIDEAGSDHLDQLLAAADSVAVCALAEVEVLSTIARKRRQKLISATGYEQVKQELIADLQTFEVIPVERSVLDGAIRLLEQFPLRGADAIHLAAARSANIDLFVTSDLEQRAAAEGAGLNVLDPTKA